RSGQLGSGASSDELPFSAAPVEVVALSNVSALVAGPAHTCAILLEGSVKCWGANEVGQLGDPTTGPGPRPSPVQARIFDATLVSRGASSTCVRRANGFVTCVGDPIVDAASFVP